MPRSRFATMGNNLKRCGKPDRRRPGAGAGSDPAAALGRKRARERNGLEDAKHYLGSFKFMGVAGAKEIDNAGLKWLRSPRWRMPALRGMTGDQLVAAF